MWREVVVVVVVEEDGILLRIGLCCVFRLVRWMLLEWDVGGWNAVMVPSRHDVDSATSAINCGRHRLVPLIVIVANAAFIFH